MPGFYVTDGNFQNTRAPDPRCCSDPTVLRPKCAARVLGDGPARHYDSAADRARRHRPAANCRLNDHLPETDMYEDDDRDDLLGWVQDQCDESRRRHTGEPGHPVANPFPADASDPLGLGVTAPRGGVTANSAHHSDVALDLPDGDERNGEAVSRPRPAVGDGLHGEPVFNAGPAAVLAGDRAALTAVLLGVLPAGLDACRRAGFERALEEASTPALGWLADALVGGPTRPPRQAQRRPPRRRPRGPLPPQPAGRRRGRRRPPPHRGPPWPPAGPAAPKKARGRPPHGSGRAGQGRPRGPGAAPR